MSAMSRCDNCQVARPTEDLNEIKDFEQRVEPGGIVPSGECPDCGALAYPASEFELYPNATAEVVYQGTPVYGQHLNWIPVVTKDGQVGLAIKSKDGSREEYLYFNPSIDERNVFIYHGDELSVVEDEPESFRDVAEGWDA